MRNELVAHIDASMVKQQMKRDAAKRVNVKAAKGGDKHEVAGLKEVESDDAAMLEAINPAEFCEKPLGRIVRDSVPVQGNLYDCGVHVLIWLLQWSPRARLTYTDADVAIFRSNLMWWLFSHPQNIVKDKALALLDDHVQPKRARIV